MGFCFTNCWIIVMGKDMSHIDPPTMQRRDLGVTMNSLVTWSLDRTGMKNKPKTSLYHQC